MELMEQSVPTAVSFDQTVPRALVDRGDATMVLITSWTRRDNELTAGAVWPRLGGYYTMLDHEVHDPLLVLETFRQCALLIAHVVDDVPLATMQIMRSLTFRAHRAGLKVTADPTEVTVVMRTGRQERGHQAILQTVIDCSMYRGGDLVASGTGRAVVPPAAQYLRVRGRDPLAVSVARRQLPPGVEPVRAGRALERDVVISPGDGPGRYRLRIDPQHPNFFDNPTDHTPGMLLTEAMRQAVVAESGDPHFLPLGLTVHFHRFVELDAPGEVLVRRVPDGFETEVRQFDKLAARAEWPVVDGADA
jgi:2-oxo-3-(phosphooxy)propyl 3-oxoalkanoate synthase